MSIKTVLHRLNRRDQAILPSFSKFSKIIFISFLIFLASKVITYISAQTADTPPIVQYQQAIKEGNNQEAWLDNALSANAVSIFSGFYGEIPADYYDYYKKTGVIPSFIPGGIVGKSAKMIASTFNPPASGIQYLAELKDNILGKPAYAQGVGFSNLQFLLPVWKIFRNMIYVFTALIFVVIGIMIILRIKISPQAVITIQSAIPQVISTLVLITFSYAIAGLLIDIGNLILGIFVALIYQAKGLPLTQNLMDVSILSSMTLNFQNLTNPNFETLSTLAYRSGPSYFGLVLLSGLVGGIMGGFFLNDVGEAIGNVIGGFLGGTVVAIVIGIVMMIWMVKLFFGLIKTYINIIIKIILAPLEIGIGAFPSSKIGFGTWFIDLFANIMVFPIVTIYLILVNFILDKIWEGFRAGNAIWTPGPLNGPGIEILSASISLAALALLSKLPEMIPQFIFMIKPSPFGQAIGQGLEGIGKGPAANLAKQATMESYASNVRKRVKDKTDKGLPLGTFLGLQNDLVKGGEKTNIISSHH
jgi:hypothetical protein